MVNFKKLADRAKDVVDKRGGPDALKADANQLKDIATGKGSLKEKAMAAKDAVKDPGATAEAAAKTRRRPAADSTPESRERHAGGQAPQGNAKRAPEVTPEAEERHGGGPTR